MTFGSMALVAAADAVDDARQEIDAANRVYEQAQRRGDVQAQLELYTDDARLFPPYAQPINGRTAIEKHLREQADGLRGQVVEVELKTSSLEVEGDLAIETGTNTLKIGNTPPLKGQSLVVWKKAQGKWKIHREMWNFSTSHEEGLLKIVGDDGGAPGNFER